MRPSVFLKGYFPWTTSDTRLAHEKLENAWCRLTLKPASSARYTFNWLWSTLRFAVDGLVGVANFCLHSQRRQQITRCCLMKKTYSAKPTGDKLDFRKSIEEYEIPPEVTSGTPGKTSYILSHQKREI